MKLLLDSPSYSSFFLYFCKDVSYFLRFVSSIMVKLEILFKHVFNIKLYLLIVFVMELPAERINFYVSYWLGLVLKHAFHQLHQEVDILYMVKMGLIFLFWHSLLHFFPTLAWKCVSLKVAEFNHFFNYRMELFAVERFNVHH